MGPSVGASVGTNVGSADGETVGNALGPFVGVTEGDAVIGSQVWGDAVQLGTHWKPVTHPQCQALLMPAKQIPLGVESQP